MLAKGVVALVLANSSLAQRDAPRDGGSYHGSRVSQNPENRVGVSDEFKRWRSTEQFKQWRESNAKISPARGEFMIQNRTAPVHSKREPEKLTLRTFPEKWSRSLTIDQMIDNVREREEAQERDVQTKTRTRPTKAERRANYLKSLAEQDIDEVFDEEIESGDGEHGGDLSLSDNFAIDMMESVSDIDLLNDAQDSRERGSFNFDELNILSQEESDELELDFNKEISQENRADEENQQTILDLDFDKMLSQVRRGPGEDSVGVGEVATTTTAATTSTTTTQTTTKTTTTPEPTTTTELEVNTQIESNDIEIDSDEFMLNQFSNLMRRKRSENTRIENYFIQGLISKARVEGMPPKIREAIQSELAGNRAEGSINCLNNPDCDPPITLRGIWQYGCWCNFGADLTTGIGMPVTPYDQKCRSLQLCLRCAAVDGMDGGYECNPLTSTYQVDVSAVLSAPDPAAIIAETCDADNANDMCAQSLCMCEMELIRAVIDLLWEEVSSEKNVYLHENGFDAGENCVSGQALGGGQQQCCGYYPQRYPFLDQSHLTCCRENGQERIYNALLQSCCPGVGVVNSPSC